MAAPPTPTTNLPGPENAAPAVRVIIGVVLVGLVVGGLWYWKVTHGIESTDDAYTDGRAVVLAPVVSGHVKQLLVDDNQFLHKGDPILRIDPRDYQSALDQALGQQEAVEGQIASTQHALEVARVSFPARFQLVAAMNPCPCGYVGEPSGRCRCTLEQIQRYRNKLSGPLLDRIDLHVTVARESTALNPGKQSGDDTASASALVAEARERQQLRQGCANAFLDLPGLRQHCKLAKADEGWL